MINTLGILASESTAAPVEVQTKSPELLNLEGKIHFTSIESSEKDIQLIEAKLAIAFQSSESLIKLHSLDESDARTIGIESVAKSIAVSALEASEPNIIVRIWNAIVEAVKAAYAAVAKFFENVGAWAKNQREQVQLMTNSHIKAFKDKGYSGLTLTKDSVALDNDFVFDLKDQKVTKFIMVNGKPVTSNDVKALTSTAKELVKASEDSQKLSVKAITLTGITALVGALKSADKEGFEAKEPKDLKGFDSVLKSMSSDITDLNKLNKSLAMLSADSKKFDNAVMENGIDASLVIDDAEKFNLNVSDLAIELANLQNKKHKAPKYDLKITDKFENIPNAFVNACISEINSYIKEEVDNIGVTVAMSMKELVTFGKMAFSSASATAAVIGKAIKAAPNKKDAKKEKKEDK